MMYEGVTQYQKCLECPFHIKCVMSTKKIAAEFDRKPVKLSQLFAKPYKSKYFDDKRYEPPRDPAEEVWCAMDY